MKILSSPCHYAAIISSIALITPSTHAFSSVKDMRSINIHETSSVVGPLFAAPNRRDFLESTSRRRIISNAVEPDAPEPAPKEDESSETATTNTSTDGRYDVSKLVAGGSTDDDGGKGGSGAGFNQFDPVLTATSFLSRRFGIFGGLAIFGILAAVEGNEIVKGFQDATPSTGSGETVTTPSGLKITESLIGKGGSAPLPGYIIGLNAIVSIGDKTIYDTTSEKPIAFKLGQRPFQNVICEGVEEGIKGMKVGGKRRLEVPKNLGPPGVELPPGIPLIYEIELTEVLSGYF
mmetsp:Transcript_14686/g.17370  ORF Transcript_14686/g.17370 Transcript_14686/m.17370 type:complete len:291 (-) Transcript_14686:299-1171(-)